MPDHDQSDIRHQTSDNEIKKVVMIESITTT